MDAAEKAGAEREIAEAVDAYERALMQNDTGALAAFFREGPETVRMMTDAGLYGHDAITAFRAGRDVSDVAREITRRQVTALTPEIGVAVAEYRRRASGRRGCQSQTWLKEDGVWRIAAAHVSVGPAPIG